MKTRKYARGTYIPNELVISLAFKEMSKSRNAGAAIQVFLIFRLKLVYGKTPGKTGKRDEKIPINSRELQFTYDEANRLGFTNGRFDRALDVLVEYGFLDIVKTGMGLHKMTTIYGISERWKKYGTDKFEHIERQKAKQYNMGFQPGNDMWKRANRKK